MSTVRIADDYAEIAAGLNRLEANQPEIDVMLQQYARQDACPQCVGWG